MERRDLWRRIAARPHSVRFGELEQLLVEFGWSFERAGKGDHLVYRRGGERKSIPYRRGNVLAIYVREVLRLTEEEDDE